MSIHLYFSNNIETLAASFAEKVSDTHDLFNPSTIIVPNPYLQKWLQLKIAESDSISINYKFSFLNDGLWDTLSSINDRTEIPTLLEQTDLQLLLYITLNGLSGKEPRVKPLLDYLGSEDEVRKSDYEKKAWQLSILLSRYFLEYEYYREEMINYWLTGKLVYNTEMEASQQYLYHMIFKKNGYRDIVDQSMLTLSQYWNRSYSNLLSDNTRTLYLFGKSQISPFHTRMLYELGKYISIYLYQVNPCSEFWEDVTTPGEDRWKRIKSIKIDENNEGLSLAHNENENYLLKLWGKSGRETVKLLSLLEEAGSSEMNTTSEWLFPKIETPSDSCLHLVQNQILNRISPTDKSVKIKRDRSIQIASCSDIFRETETVYNSILYNLTNNSDLSMSDIAIMVPDMSEYGPVIHTVFSQHPKRISYSIIDSTAAIDSLFGKAVRTLLEIVGGTFSRKTVFDLIFNQCFLEAHDMNFGDARICLSWVDSLNIFHTFKKSESVDPEHNLYTWQQGLQRLRFGRILQPHDTYSDDGVFLNFKNIVPFADMNTGNLKLLNTFTSFIELLYAKTKNIQHKKASGTEWLSIIKSLIDSFIVVPADRPEEKFVYSTLMACMRKPIMIDKLSNSYGGEGLSFLFIKEFIVENIIAISSTRGSYLSGGINISALIPKRQLPFKLVYVMGMQEGLFPGSADTSTLNIMNIRRHIADVSKPDANRYLFLETLLSTREKLYITYVSKDLQKDQNFFPNSVLGQLLTYLNNYVITDEFSIITIPATGSSENYLRSDLASNQHSDLISSRINGKIQLTSYSLSDRIVLLQHADITHHFDPVTSSDLKKIIVSSIPDFTVMGDIAASHNQIASLSLRDLAYFINNPAESTLRWHLGMYDENDNDRSSNELEPFFSVFPYSYRFINDTLNYHIFNNSQHSIETYMNYYYRHAQLMSATPHGAFGDVDFDEFKSVINERFYGSNSISHFIDERKQYRCYRNLRYGTAAVTAQPDLSLSSLKFHITRNNQTINVELSGTLPILWKNPENDNCETLVITSSEKPSITHLILPFLFYMTASTGNDEKLSRLIGNKSFTIHISFRHGISSYTYRLDRKESLMYINRIISDFLDEESFDHLPLSVIFGHSSLHPVNMTSNPVDAERVRYHELLARSIDEDSEKLFSSFRSTKIFDLIDAKVPTDAYDKVRDRLGILFVPFTSKGSRAHE